MLSLRKIADTASMYLFFQLILAMGNYMNEGNQRVGQAAGFRIKFLSQVSTSAYMFVNITHNIITGKRHVLSLYK